ncbi:MAG TPA: aminotransferase class V-fold PLP-dependent enzyme [Bacilli bacterium]
MKISYFDNAATSWPKPPSVIEAMSKCMLEYGANPGRGSHKMAVQASRVLFETRHNIARLCGVKNPVDISFALNTTTALNLAIKGFLKDGDHVICTSIEHNSVRRPLEFLKRKINIQITYLESDLFGNIDLSRIQGYIQKNTKLFVCNHSSNLLGNILPLDKISEMIKSKGIRLLVDAAQTMGSMPLDIHSMGIDMLAFPGHKGLLGPQGTGGLYISPDIELEPLLHGGTGSQSEEIDQPSIRPDRYESGTQNTVGAAGLNEGVKFILKETTEKIHMREYEHTQRIIEGLSLINGLQILGPKPGVDRTSIVSFNLPNVDSSEVAFVLDQSFQLAVRSGFHCTPLAHQTAGTKQTGAVRASPGYYTTPQEIDHLIYAIAEINKHFNRS